MGQAVAGTKQIKYKTRDGISISYIFYDLKGKNRFPHEPNNEAQINAMFEMTLSDIQATQQQLNELKGFNSKYRYRFTIMHKRKIEQSNSRNSLRTSTATLGFIMDQVNHLQENKSQMKRNKLEERLKQIESSKSAIKMTIGSLDKFISEQKSHYQFIQIDGVNRILNVLKRETKANNEGYKTNFGNQIDILRFIKSYSSHHPKQFYTNIENREDYGNIIMDTFHPICTPVTAYCLSLLEDYIERAEDCKKISLVLKQYAKKQNYANFISVFIQTLQTSSNVIMVFYILKFLNEVMAGTVDQNDVTSLRNEMVNAKYTFTIQAIKMRLQQNFYKLDACTFINVSQQIFKYASKGKKQYQNSVLNPQSFMVRNTLSMKDLQQQLVLNFFDLSAKTPDNEDKQSQQNQQQFMTVYLGQSSTKQFNRFVLDVLKQIRTYYKLQLQIDTINQEDGDFSQNKQQIYMQKKMNDIKLEDYLKHIRANCIKNDCTDTMFGALKNLQYFQRTQWKKLDSFILEEIGVNKKGNVEQLENVKKTLKQKQQLIKKLIKQNIDLKAQLATKSKETALPSLSNAASFLPPPPSLNNIAISSPSSTLPNLPPPPSLSDAFNLLPPPPPSLNDALSTLPPPPPLVGMQSSSNSMSLPPILPPPPSLGDVFGSLPPPPSLDAAMPTLPPPPSFDFNSLPPPPPMLGNLLPNLPPPPSLSLDFANLPPPPPSLNSLSNTLPNLPPPPSLDSLSNTLPPPPPSLDSLSILPPPPPMLGDFSLPPPPPMLDGSSLGLPSLPTLPSLGNNMMPSLPTLPGLGGGLSMPMSMPVEKVKQKKKPKVALKNCNYAVLPYEKIKGTVWQQVNDQKVQLDFTEMQQLFSKKVEQPKQMKTMSMMPKLSSMQEKKQPVKLIGAQKWRNVQIVLTKLKIPKGEIAKTLLQCTGKFSSPSILQSIKNILPTQDQQQMVKMYSGDANELGKPQTFYRQLISVPQYGNRIKSMIFASHKDDSYFELQQKIQQLIEAFDSLQNNYRLHHILQVALAVGNYLNGTNLKGGAWGFKIDSIQRLEEVKSMDSKMNAAFFVIKEVWKKFQFPMFTKDQLSMYQTLSKLPTSQVSTDVGELRKTLVAVRKAQKSYNPQNPDDAIGKFCQEMKKQLQLKVQQFTQLTKKLQNSYNDCCLFYCEDSKKMPSDEFGKKIFKCIHFVYETQKTYKAVQDRNKKEEDRKAIKSQIKFVQKQEPKKVQVMIKSDIIAQTGLPLPPPPKNLPKPPQPQISKQQKLKQYEKSQKKDLQDLMKKRQTKVVAYRKSKAPTGPMGLGVKNDFDDINFLKGLK